MTASGIPERTAAWLITLFNVADLSSRVVLCFVGDHLPIGRITVLVVTAAIGAISSFLLTLGVLLPIFIAYCISKCPFLASITVTLVVRSFLIRFSSVMPVLRSTRAILRDVCARSEPQKNRLCRYIVWCTMLENIQASSLDHSAIRADPQ